MPKKQQKGGFYDEWPRPIPSRKQRVLIGADKREELAQGVLETA